MKKTKKLVLDIAKIRELVTSDLERANGGYVNSGGSNWCSSIAAKKCTYGCNSGMSITCVNR